MYARNRRNRGNSCRCNCRNCRELPECPENPVLANSYVPYQYLDEVFEPEEALANGTAFPELVRPYVQNQSDRKSTRLNSSHQIRSYAVCCLKKKERRLHRPSHPLRDRTMTRKTEDRRSP